MTGGAAEHVPEELMREVETSQSYSNTTTWCIVMLPAIVVHISDNIVNPFTKVYIKYSISTMTFLYVISK